MQILECRSIILVTCFLKSYFFCFMLLLRHNWQPLLYKEQQRHLNFISYKILSVNIIETSWVYLCQCYFVLLEGGTQWNFIFVVEVLPSCSRFIVWKLFLLLLANIVCFNASAICDLRLYDKAHLLKADDVLVIPTIGPPHFPMPTNHWRLLSDSFGWICLQSNWQQSCPFWTLLIIFVVTPPSLKCTPIPF